MGARAARPHRAEGANLNSGSPDPIVSPIKCAHIANTPCTSGALQAGTPALPALRALVVGARHEKNGLALRLTAKVLHAL